MLSYERLCQASDNNNWALLSDILQPKYFPRDEKGTLIDKKILAKVEEMLVTQSTDIPTNVKIVLLKCLVNSCLEFYVEKNKNDESPHDCHKLYSDDSPNDVLFPYDGTIGWVIKYITSYLENPEDSFNDRLEILRLGVQFLCNFATFACRSDDLPPSLISDDFKAAILTLVASEYVPVARAACAFAHNILKKWPEYYGTGQINEIARALIDADQLGIKSAGDCLLILLRKSGYLRMIYEDLSIERQLQALEIILQEARKSAYSEENDSELKANFPVDVVQFLAERFRKRSDLILKTVDSYLDGMEPTEITLLLNIIGVISSKDSLECQQLQSDKSLVINCIFLLKSLHMTGRSSDNNFTPVQKLSEVAPNQWEKENSSNGHENIQNHPAFGFKAGLIRALGNLAHRHKGNQDLLRETDAIPLLLDCCNIDARNPLIMQWTIFALRNLCEANPENQEIIRNSNRVGIVDNDIIKEMGIKLHEDEDGKAIGIIPLPRNK